MEVASYARVEVVDWDEDGDLDVLLGETDAYINLYLNTSNPSSVSDPFEQLPTDFLLAQNYPNPFNSRTTICYYVPQPGIIKLSIFNLAGQLVETVLNESNMPGLHSVRWDASTISSGTYIIRLSVDQFSEIRKCIIVK